MKTALLVALAIAVTATIGVVAANEAPKAHTDLHSINLELKHIKARVMKEQGWSAEHTELVATEYRKFWLLHAKYPDAYLVPSLDVDEMWHAHILFTAKYAADCDRIFGSFLHHFPTVDDDDSTTNEASAAATPSDATAAEGLNVPSDEKVSDYQAMLALYESEFGVKPNAIWVADAACSKCSGCSAKCGSNSTAIVPPAPAGCGNCHGKRGAKKAGGCGNCHAASKKDGKSAGCGNCHGASKNVKSGGCGNCHGASKQVKSGGCGNCHGGAKKSKSGGCGNCHASKAKSGKTASCGNCGSNCKGSKRATGKSAGCGNCHGASKQVKSGGCGNCHGGAKKSKSGGCGNCHGGKAKARRGTPPHGGCGNCHASRAGTALKKAGVKAAGCGSCGSNCKGANKLGAKKPAGCGNCHAASAKKNVKAGGCGNCHAAKATKPADATPAPAATESTRRVVHLRP